MKKEFILAGVWVWISGGLAAGQLPGQTLVNEPIAPASPVNRNEANNGLILPISVQAGAGNGGIPDLDAKPACQGGFEADNCSPSRFWANVDYLLWWLKPVCLKPPTLTLGSAADAIPGAVGQPHTQVVMGDHKFEFSGASGISVGAGTWLTSDQVLSFEVGGFLLEKAEASQSFRSSNGSPPSYIPFQDPSNVNQALPFGVPGVVNGTSAAVGSSRLWGAEGNLSAHFSTAKGGVVLAGAVLFGLRYLDLEDRVTVTNQQNLVSDPLGFAIGSDNFTTRNQFYGGQLGSRLGLSGGNWSLDIVTKMALGITHQVSEVFGQPLLAGSVASPLLLPGPYLALPSNIGRQSANRITLVPDVSLTVHYNLTSYLSLSLGYSCLYWNKVLCPGDQMDTHVNITQLPFHGPITGPGLPAPMLMHTDAFAQGVRAGVEFRF
jgi:hypothetical protein